MEPEHETISLIDNNGTLIDNFFCKLCKSVLESIAGILTKRFSDHQPYFMMLNMNQKTNPPPKFIKKIQYI